jgi:hypothetical protein
MIHLHRPKQKAFGEAKKKSLQNLVFHLTEVPQTMHHRLVRSQFQVILTKTPTHLQRQHSHIQVEQ